jgi:hypothetical protein
MKKIIFLMFILVLSSIFAGNPRGLIFNVQNSNNEPFDFTDGNNDDVQFRWWIQGREDEVCVWDAGYNWYGMIGDDIVSLSVIQTVLGNLPTQWQEGEIIMLQIKHHVNGGWYEPKSGVVSIKIEIPDDSGSPIFYGLEPYEPGSGDPIVLNTFKSDTGIENNIPQGTNLSQNYPNPFNPTTTINFSIENEGPIKLNVYNTSGEIVSELINNNISADNHTVNFDGSNLSAGVYYYILEAENHTLSNKMILLK